MIDEPTDNAAGNTRKAGSSDRRYFVIAAIILMVDFIRLLSPADELPSSTVRMMSILIELCLVIGLVGLGIKILCAGAMDRSLSIFFLAVGVIAGLGIFGIRLSGGPRVELPSRATGSSTRLEGLPKQLHEQIKSYTELAEKLQTNGFVRTLQKNRTELQSIPHPDIREARELFGQLRDSRERILQLLTEADSQKINLSSPFPERGLIQKESGTRSNDCMALPGINLV